MANKPTVVERQERSERTRRNAEIIWYAVLSLIAGLVLFAAVISIAALVPRYCATCHAAEAKAMVKTAHDGIHCDACHGSTTLFGMIDRRLTLVSMVGSQFVPGRQQVVTDVDNEMCLTCHAKDVAAGVVSANGIRMSHKEVIEAKTRCTQCHATTAHGKATANRGGYNMDMCLECHSTDYKNLKTCEVCHVGKARPQQGVTAVSTWKIIHGPNWRKTHGLGNLNTCKACHGPDYCVPCHNMPMPHSDAFPQRHGQEVLKRATGDKDCLTCHRKAACDGCHGVPMPHPEQFMQSHGDTVKKDGDKACFRCHQESSCVACHTRHAHPGLAKDYIDKLRANPVPVP